MRTTLILFMVHGVMLVVLCVFASGCVTNEFNIATGQEELYFISDERERTLGLKIARRLEENVPMQRDDETMERLHRIGDALVAVCDRPELVYHFGVIENDELNAVSLPGGYVYVNKGILDMVESDDELAGVIAHEIAHIAARHSVKRVQSAVGYTVFQLLIAQAKNRQNRSAARGTDQAIAELFMEYSRDDEMLADRLSVRYTKKAGYDPTALISFLEKLQQDHLDKPIRVYRAYRTHPHIDDRLRVVREEIYGHTTFDDYMNKTKQ